MYGFAYGGSVKSFHLVLFEMTGDRPQSNISHFKAHNEKLRLSIFDFRYSPKMVIGFYRSTGSQRFSERHVIAKSFKYRYFLLAFLSVCLLSPFIPRQLIPCLNCSTWTLVGKNVMGNVDNSIYLPAACHITIIANVCI